MTDILANPILLSVVVGIVGAASRLLLQRVRDGEFGDYGKIAALLVLGGIGGWLAFLVAGYVPLAVWAMGFVAPDVIENLAATYGPSS